MVKVVKRRSVSSVSVRSDGSLEKTKSSPVVGAHGARDGRAVERAEGNSYFALLGFLVESRRVTLECQTLKAREWSAEFRH